MTEREVRTVRSFCRICTAVCGILVDVAGDEVVRVRGDPDHPLSHGYTCAKGRALPQMHHHPDRLERPLMRIAATAPADDVGRLPRRPRRRGCAPSSTATARRRSASSSAAASAWTRPATGWREALLRRARHAGAVQPADHRRHREGAGVRPGRRLPGPQSPRRRRARERSSSTSASTRSCRTVTRRDARSGDRASARCGRAPTSGSSIRVAPRPRGSPRTTSRRDRAPTTRSSRSWCASCCATVPTATCSSTARSGSDALAAAVEPFTLEHTARVADVAEAELTRAARRGAPGRPRRGRHRNRRHDVGRAPT